ncbi:MAG: aminopeptidase N, partial [Xanthomonadales bacterium]|nr:aminopeptidase N [Xanthomonadales bacterium]
MSAATSSEAAVDIRLADYQPPPWLCPNIELAFDLGVDFTEVSARLHVKPNPEVAPAPLRLDGESLELLSVSVDGERLGIEDYELQSRALLLPSVDRAAVVETRVRIHPAANTRLEGLYASGGMLLTQCEAEGFRRITFFPDRPDVLSVYDVTLRA